MQTGRRRRKGEAKGWHTFLFPRHTHSKNIIPMHGQGQYISAWD